MCVWISDMPIYKNITLAESLDKCMNALCSRKNNIYKPLHE